MLHRDVIWDPTHPTVGIEGMRHYLSDLATAFPDFFVEVRGSKRGCCKCGKTQHSLLG
jgi:hypothetical protein